MSSFVNELCICMCICCTQIISNLEGIEARRQNSTAAEEVARFQHLFFLKQYFEIA